MASWTIYHDPRSPRSRHALKHLMAAGITPNIVYFLKQVPTVQEIEMLVMKLGIPPEQLLRKDDALYKAEFKGLRLHDHEWIKVIHEHPTLLQRPIIVKDHRAVIGRPAGNIDDLLGCAQAIPH